MTKVQWKLVSISVLTITGSLLTNAVWVFYYLRYDYNPHHALVWTISLATTALLYLIYLRFLKFMERA